jgi:hypothetical protein
MNAKPHSCLIASLMGIGGGCDGNTFTQPVPFVNQPMLNLLGREGKKYDPQCLQNTLAERFLILPRCKR